MKTAFEQEAFFLPCRKASNLFMIKKTKTENGSFFFEALLIFFEYIIGSFFFCGAMKNNSSALHYSAKARRHEGTKARM
jgi:hypothetical protein